jgi:NitT/TauT family transport system substrate-binding protein
MKRRQILVMAAVTASAIAFGILPSAAQETVKLAVGQRGNWDTSVPELGKRAGIFKKHGLELDILYTQGGGETQQAVLSGSVDVGIAAGTGGVFGAFAKGAPVRIIGAQTTGAADYWYVRADSPLKTIKDAAADTTIAYSTNGSSTHTIVRALIKQHDLKAKTVATGGPPGTFTQVMSGQINVGWAAPPFGVDALDQSKIRIVARGNDLPEIKDQTIRLLITNVQTLQRRKDVIDRFIQAYRETVDWMYSSPEVIKEYAQFNNISEDLAKRIRDEFFSKAMLVPDKIQGIDALMEDAVTFKNISAPLTKEQLSELIQIPAPKS